MAPPNVPGVPGVRLPAVEVNAPRDVPHSPLPPRPQPEYVELRGRGWSANIPAVAITGIVTAVVMRLTTPAVPPDDTLRRDVRDLATEQRAIAQSDRETRAQQSQHEQQLNAVRADVASLRADVRELVRAIDELKKPRTAVPGE
jgi:septal ring factor EnvC (AmiA/AmiB activator)